jgi:4-hydroxy-tetrahydrodipicolinate reductase
MTRIGISGAAGRMGRRLLEMVLLEPKAALVAAVEGEGHPALGQPAYALCQAEIPAQARGRDVPVTADLPDTDIDVIIDFSSPQQTVRMSTLAAQRNFALITGTTGLSADERKSVAVAAATVPLIIAPNCSTGVNVMFNIAARIAEILGDGYDVEIVESHHRFKKDAPSGTALRLAERIAEALERDLDQVGVYGRKGLLGERPEEQIAIHALRRGDVVGEHTVSFTTLGETLELTHRAHSRDAFARGAVRAAMWLAEKEPGSYTMNQVLNLDE